MLNIDYYGHIGEAEEIKVSHLDLSESVVTVIKFHDELRVVLTNAQTRDLRDKLSAEIINQHVAILAAATQNEPPYSWEKPKVDVTCEENIKTQADLNKIQSVQVEMMHFEDAEAETAAQHSVAQQQQVELLETEIKNA